MDLINQTLLENIKNSISDVVPKKKIGIAFSGGVDSTLVSKICTDMGFDVVLLTIGFSESHDILFSKEVNEHLNYSHHILEIDPETFPKITLDIHKVIDTDNLSWNENCIAFLGIMPKELDIHRYIDYKMMFQKAFLDPLNMIVDGLGWSTEKKATLEDLFA